MINKSIYSKSDGLLAFRISTSDDPDLTNFSTDDFWIFDTYEDEFTKCVDGVVQELSETEITNLYYDKNLEDFREERNVKLTESDWTQVIDSPLSDSKKTEWHTYRQALRDMPSQEGFDPLNPSYPTEPT